MVQKRLRTFIALSTAVFALVICVINTIQPVHAIAEAAPADMSTPVYYNPEGGQNFHGDQRCSAVRKRYLPLSMLTFSDLYAPPYDTLTPCANCSPPAKPQSKGASQATSEIDTTLETGIAHALQAGELAGLPFALSAEYAVLYNVSSGQVLYEKKADARCEPASLTKLLAVLTAYANGGENIQFPVKDEISLVGSNSSIAYLRKGDVLSFSAIVDAVLLSSGNDATYTLAVNIARHIEGKSLSNEDALQVFAKLMNETASNLGCTDSHFVSVDGYPSSEHYSTAYDILRIAVKAASTEVTAESAQRSRVYHVFKNKRDVVWQTTNLLLQKDSRHYYEYATGMKTGSTGDKFSLAASAEKDGTRLIAILINADSDENRFAEAALLLDYGFEFSK